MGLRARLLLLVLLPVIPALVLAVYSNLEQRQIGRLRVEKDASRMVQLAAANQVAEFEATRQHLAALSRFPQALGNDLPTFTVFFAGMAKTYTNYLDFGLIETNGNLVACSFRPSGTVDLSEQAHFQRVLKTHEFAVGDYQAGDGVTTARLLFGYPVVDQKGGLARVMYSALNLDVLKHAAAKTPLPEGGVINVFDRSGHVLVRWPNGEKWIGQKLAGSDVATTSMADREGTAEMRGFDDTSRLYAFEPIRLGHDVSVYMSVGIPATLAYGELNQILIRNLTILGLVALLALLAARIYADHYILNPVKALVGATSRLATGDLSGRTGILQTSGELNHLARAFDEMAGILQRNRTELEHSAEALRKSEERLRLILDSALDAVITINDKGMVMSWNPEAQRIFGWTPEQIVGRNLAGTIVPPRFRETHGGSLDDYFTSPGEAMLNKRFEMMVLGSDGREIPVEMAVTSIQLPTGLAFSAFLRDITERKRLDEEIHALNASLEKRVMERTKLLEEAHKEMEAYSYSVSHDLRAPLRHIAGFVGILQREAAAGLGEVGQRHLAIIAKSAEQMGILIDDLLAFSRMGRTEMRRTPVKMDDLVAEVIREMRADIQGREVEWMIGPLPELLVDRGLMKQVWINLIGNAVKYTRQRPRAEIAIGCAKNAQDEWEFSVQDNGAGFDMRYADKLFGVFQRLHHAEEFEGTGIGLANVQRIVVRHGGRTWANGKVGHGAVFHFTIPNSPSP